MSGSNVFFQIQRRVLMLLRKSHVSLYALQNRKPFFIYRTLYRMFSGFAYEIHLHVQYTFSLFPSNIQTDRVRSLRVNFRVLECWNNIEISEITSRTDAKHDVQNLSGINFLFSREKCRGEPSGRVRMKVQENPKKKTTTTTSSDSCVLFAHGRGGTRDVFDGLDQCFSNFFVMGPPKFNVKPSQGPRPLSSRITILPEKLLIT